MAKYHWKNDRFVLAEYETCGVSDVGDPQVGDITIRDAITYPSKEAYYAAVRARGCEIITGPATPLDAFRAALRAWFRASKALLEKTGELLRGL
jgi:hypothetical protein